MKIYWASFLVAVLFTRCKVCIVYLRKIRRKTEICRNKFITIGSVIVSDINPVITNSTPIFALSANTNKNDLQPASRIIGGDPAKEGEFKGVVNKIYKYLF